jgi:hypothetical protein
MKNLKSILAASALGLALTVGACDRDSTGPTAPSAAPNQNAPTVDQQVASGPLVLPTNQTFTSALGSATITSVTITQLSRNAAGDLLATGTVSGTFTNLLNQTTNFTQNFTNIPIEITQQGRRCQILFLDLGPLFLNVLGLEINLSRIILDIDAVQGPGNLLGNLLCALVGLLDGPNLAALDQVLAQINAILSV